MTQAFVGQKGVLETAVAAQQVMTGNHSSQQTYLRRGHETDNNQPQGGSKEQHWKWREQHRDTQHRAMGEKQQHCGAVVVVKPETALPGGQETAHLFS